MPRKKKQPEESLEMEESVETPSPLTWEDIRECIGPGAIVSFQVSAEGYNPATHGTRRQWHPRIVASLLKSCATEDEVADVLESQRYPAGSYLLTARSGPGPRDWWKPNGATVSVGVTVGDGGLQEIDTAGDDEEEIDGSQDDPVSKSLLNQIRHNDLMRQVRTSEAALDDVDSRSRSRERRDALDIFRELRGNGDPRGSVAEVLAAIVPLAMPFLERMASPQADLGTKAAESVIQMTTAAARTQADIASSVMRDMLQTQMDMMMQLQRDKLGLGEEPDPIKSLIPHALQAVLPALAAAGAGASTASHPVSPQAPSSQPAAAAPLSQQTGPAVTVQGMAISFVRTMVKLAYVRPSATVIYEKTIRSAFGLLPENVRVRLTDRLKDESKQPYLAFAEFASEVDPAIVGDLQALVSDNDAALYLVKLLSYIAEDFIDEEDDEGVEKQPQEASA